jgi:hypothetical protein
MMDEKRARDLAHAYGTIEGRTPLGKRRDDEYNGRHWEDMKWGITLQLIAAIPDAAIAVAMKRMPLDAEGEATAVVAAVDEQALYVVECTTLSSLSSGPTNLVPTVKARRIPLDPSTGRVSIFTTFGSSFSGKPLHENQWTFEIGSETLTFESERVADHVGDAEEQFARAVAKALGYDLPAAGDAQALAA